MMGVGGSLNQDSTTPLKTPKIVRPARAASSTGDKNTIRSIQRAVEILSFMVSKNVPCDLDVIASESGLKKTTAHRILQTLADVGMVERDIRTRRYKAGRRLVSLGLAAYAEFDLSRIAAPILEAVRDALNETANLTVLERNEIVIVERFPSPHLLKLALDRGSRLPVHCTATGKAILAHLPQSRRQQVVASLALQRLTPKTLATPETLLADLEIIRRRGYAICDEEFAVGQVGYATPILDHTGECLAAVNVSFLLARHPDRTRHQDFIEHVLNAGERISREMGYAGPWPAKDADFESAENAESNDREA